MRLSPSTFVLSAELALFVLAYTAGRKDKNQTSKVWPLRMLHSVGHSPFPIYFHLCWNILVHVWFYQATAEFSGVPLEATPELLGQLQKFYDTDSEITFSGVYESQKAKVLHLLVAALIVIELLFFVSHPGKVSKKAPHCISNDGLVSKCDTCNNGVQRHVCHSYYTRECIPNYWLYDREMCNDVGLWNFALFTLMTLMHFVVMLAYSSLFISMLLRFSKIISKGLESAITLGPEEELLQVVPSFFSNVLALVTSKTNLKLVLLGIMSLARTYALLSCLMTNFMLLHMGMPYFTYQEWRKNITRILRKERAVLEIVDKEAEIEFQTKRYEEHKDTAEPLLGYKNQKSFELAATHYLVAMPENIQPGDIVKLQMEEADSRIVEAKLLGPVEAMQVYAKLKFGRGFWGELKRYISGAKLQIKW